MTLTDSPDWLAAKAAGDTAELAVAAWFQTRGFDAFQTLGDAPFDLLLQCRVEVKRDRLAATTGNIAVEVGYRGRSSGIHDSPATYWAFVLDAEVLLITTQALRDLIASSEFPERRAGDGQFAVVKLVPVATLQGHKDVRRIPLSEPVRPPRRKAAKASR